MVLLLLLVSLLAAPCLADDLEPTVRVYASTPLESLRLEACLAHARGDSAQVLDLLGALEARLLAGEAMDAGRAAWALGLLGTVRLRAGDEDGASAAFRLMAGRLPAELICPPCAQPTQAPPAPGLPTTGGAPPETPGVEATTPPRHPDP